VGAARSRLTSVPAGRVFGVAGGTALATLSQVVLLSTVARQSSDSVWSALAIGQSIGQVAGIACAFGWNLSGPTRWAGSRPEARASLYVDSLVNRVLVTVVVLPISVAIGVIIEIPGNIAILGVLKVVLPTEEAAILKLQVNFAGAIEFDKKRLFFFAALFDSRVLFLTIEGEMGLLVAWGDDANFVVSVGGFHPRFVPPPLPFPSPVRIAVSLINTSVARVRVEGYFAVTSNTVQFGSRSEMFFGFDAINISGHLAWDVLFQFSPFYFIATISASFSLNVFGAGLFSVRIQGSLEGPAPWRAAGTGSITILFWDVSADFDVTWGESRNTELPPINPILILMPPLNNK